MARTLRQVQKPSVLLRHLFRKENAPPVFTSEALYKAVFQRKRSEFLPERIFLIVCCVCFILHVTGFDVTQQ